MPHRRLCALALAALAATPLVLATHSSSPCAAEYTTLGTGAASLYVVNDGTGMWLYVESNGHDDLQRGGFWWLDSKVEDWCWDLDARGWQIPDPDFLLF